jgi:predicted metal-dependent RNase
MSQVNYAEMSDRELKKYFLQNRQDREALEVYLDRINQRPRQIIASPGDPDFNEKIQAVIRQKLQALESNQLKD